MKSDGSLFKAFVLLQNEACRVLREKLFITVPAKAINWTMKVKVLVTIYFIPLDPTAEVSYGLFFYGYILKWSSSWWV